MYFKKLITTQLSVLYFEFVTFYVDVVQHLSRLFITHE